MFSPYVMSLNPVCQLEILSIKWLRVIGNVTFLPLAAWIISIVSVPVETSVNAHWIWLLTWLGCWRQWQPDATPPRDVHSLGPGRPNGHWKGAGGPSRYLEHFLRQWHVGICYASTYTQVTRMTKQALRCWELTAPVYMHEHWTISNVIVFAFLFTCS